MIKLLASFSIMLILFLAAGCDECKPSGRYLVVTTYAGMSNRLRTLASAKIMAALTDRQLVVDWPLQENEMPGEWVDFFTNPMTMFEQSPLYIKDGCLLKDIKNAGDDNRYIKNLGVQNNIEGVKRLAKIPEDKEAVVYYGTTLNFSPESQYMPYADYQERYRLFYQNLDPVTRITKAVAQFQKDKDFSDKFMIGVHYRSWGTGKADEGGVRQDLAHKYLTLFTDEMKKAVALPLGDTDNKPVAFFLATDDPNVKDKMMSDASLAGRVFTAPYKIDRDTIEGAQNALIDWYLLARTRYIIGTYQSSFSDEAAYLTDQKKKVSLGEAAYH